VRSSQTQGSRYRSTRTDTWFFLFLLGVGVSWDKLRASDKPTSFFYMENMAEENKVRIFINKKEMTYSRQNMIKAIYNFIPYLSIDDLNTLGNDINTTKEQIRYNEQKSREEGKNIPIQSNRYDT